MKLALPHSGANPWVCHPDFLSPAVAKAAGFFGVFANQSPTDDLQNAELKFKLDFDSNGKPRIRLLVLLMRDIWLKRRRIQLFVDYGPVARNLLRNLPAVSIARKRAFFLASGCRIGTKIDDCSKCSKAYFRSERNQHRKICGE